MTWVKEFKEFISRGNVIDLAVAVVIGAAFGKIIASFVNDIIMPFVGIIIGGIDFKDLKYVITPASQGVNELSIKYGLFIQSVVDFLIIAFFIFWFIKLINSFKKKEEVAVAVEAPRSEVLLEEIRDIIKSKSKTSSN
jgi:large conductance mechanosensitive channel